MDTQGDKSQRLHDMIQTSNVVLFVKEDIGLLPLLHCRGKIDLRLKEPHDEGRIDIICQINIVSQRRSRYESAPQSQVGHEAVNCHDQNTTPPDISGDEYGAFQRVSPKLLHSKTGAALSRDLFGVSDKVYEAIRWHTTAKPEMTVFEQIIYLADYIEPHRDFPGVEDLRKLAYEDLGAAMVLGLRMSLADIRSYGVEPHEMTQRALAWFESKER